MEREQEPIIIVGETGISLLLRVVVDLGAQVSNLGRLTVFIFSFKSNLAGLGFPLPGPGSFEEPGHFSVPGVADRLDLPIRIETVGFGNLFEDGRARLRPGSCRKDQDPDGQKTDHRYTARV